MLYGRTRPTAGGFLSHPGDKIDGMETTSIACFCSLARCLGEACSSLDLVRPGFRSPPRTASTRTIRQSGTGSVVAVRIAGRSSADVLADMVEGVLLINGLTGEVAEAARVQLLGAVSQPSLPTAA